MDRKMYEVIVTEWVHGRITGWMGRYMDEYMGMWVNGEMDGGVDG